MLRVKLDPIARDLSLMVEEFVSPQAQQRAIGRFARTEINKVDSANTRALGRRVAHSETVDGRKGAALESVKPNGGVIIAEWELFLEVLPWIARTLRERSPRVSGDYVRGHRAFADSTEFLDITKPPPATEYTFMNIVPYARKIEIGKTKSGRAFVIQVPNRIYEMVARDARGRFGRLADIKFSYRQAVGSYRLSGGRNAGASLTAPAIIVRPKS
jgi:hypothetical protein